ncbi:Copia protein [Sesamum angolense]|uniref:Copia protein n=1 Tax=Sesamum angolense TaxID=2727404 RepID=A0AAE2C5G4_9LAMI|nr:Copia protein [Sesamum angolense]
MLSLVEKLEDLKVGLDNDTYIDVILQSLPPSYDPFIVNFNMNGLEKSINELVQYEATIKKSTPSVLIGEASTSKTKGKRVGCGKRKKGKAKAKIIIVEKDAKSATVAPVGMGKRKRRMGTQQQSKANDICAYCREKGHWKRDCPNLSSNQGIFVVEVNMVTNSASWVLDTGCGAHICKDLQMLQKRRKLSKDEVVLRLSDDKAVAAEAVGIINLVISDRVMLELKNCYFVPSMIKNIIFIPLLDNDGFEFLINKNCFYLMKDGSSHLLDRGGEYLSGEFIDYLKKNGIVSQWTPPGTPQLNGVAKRRNRTLLDMIRSMMSFTELPLSFWGYALETATRFIGYLKETAGYYFYDPLSKRYLSRGMQCSWKEVFQRIPDAMNCSLRNQVRSARVPQPPERYGFLGVTDQLDNDSKNYREAMSDIDSGKWLEVMKSKIDSMSSNQVWTLVAKGYTQRPRVDFEETFSPVAMAKSIRIMLAIAAWYDYEIWQINVKTVFLNGFVEEEIYMDQSEGFTVVGEEQKGSDLVKNDFDLCVYKKVSGSYVVFLVLYVDDILLIENDIKMLGDTKASLSTQFSMKDLGEASYILGIKIFGDRSKMILGMSPKLACAGEAHWTAVKTILKYLRKTKDVFLVYGGGELILEGFRDASFQSDDDDAKSQSGFVFKLNGGVVAWKSSKQDTIADSTTEAKYIAVSEAAKEAV